MKYCTGCDKTLPVSYFHMNRSTKDGLGSQCKECRKTFRNANKPRYNEVRRLAEVRDREEMNDRFWKKTSKYHHLDWITVRQIYSDQNKKCFYCKIEIKAGNLHLEHYYPKRTDRIVIACADCNRLKWQRNGDEFIEFLKEYTSRFL